MVHVRRRDGSTFNANPVNVAVECGFYDVRTSDGETSKAVEELLSELEGDAAEVFRRIDASGEPPSGGSHDRDVLAAYLALQYTRTPLQRERMLFPERLATYLDGQELTLERVVQYLTEVHLGFEPSPNEAQGAFDFASVALQEPGVLTPELSIRTMLGSLDQLLPIFDGLCRTLEHERKGRLITSDTPVVIWREPTVRDKFEGIGLANADEIRFPLDPQKQLVLGRKTRPGSVRISPDRAEACNADLAAGCHRFVVADPGAAQRVAAMSLKPHRPVLRFNSGPLYERQPDGSDVFKGEVLHTWVPRR